MITVIVELSRYLLIILMLLFTLQSFTVLRKKTEDDKKYVLRKQIVLLLFLNFTAFLIMYLQTDDIKMVYSCAAVFGYIVAVQILYRIFYRKASMVLINNMCMLLSIGFIMLARLDFAKARMQFLIVTGGTLLSMIVPVIIRKVKHLRDWPWLYGVVGLIMLTAVLVLATATRGASLSIKIGGVTFQFSEIVKITFVFFVAGMLRMDTSFRNVVITTAVAAAHVLILVLSRDLGNALVFFISYLVMLYVATNQVRYALAGIGGGAVASVLAYFLFGHVRQRVIVWKDPIAVYNKVGGGYQVAQSLFAIGAGGWFGMGLFQGDPQSIPIVTKDFIFAAICEELGGIFAICMILVCMSCFLLIVNISMKMSKPFYKLIAMGLGTQYAVQVFLSIGGNTKFIPMTGITIPLISYGGSSVLSTIIMIAIIQGLYILREDEGEKLDRKRKKKGKKTGKKRTDRRDESGKTLEQKIEEQTEKSLNW